MHTCLFSFCFCKCLLNVKYTKRTSLSQTGQDIGEAAKNYLAYFFPLRGYPPYPFRGKPFCPKTTSGNGAYPPLPPLTEGPPSFSGTKFLIGLEMMFLY